jgi:hypothetical protein
VTGKKARLLLLAGLAAVVVVMTAVRASRKTPALAPVPSTTGEKPYPVYATPEDLLRDHKRAFKDTFDAGPRLKTLLADYYLCKALRDRIPAHCDVVDSWNLARLAPPLCLLDYYHALMYKEVFTREVPPPTCQDVAKMMKLAGARAEEMCSDKSIQQAIRRGDVAAFCGYLKSSGIAPPEDMYPCSKEYLHLAGKPESCKGIEDPRTKASCEEKSSLVKALRESSPGKALDGPYAPLVGGSCQAVGRLVLAAYESAAASFAAVQDIQTRGREMAQKVEAAQKDRIEKQRQAEEAAKRANEEREQKTGEELRKMIERTKAAQTERELREKKVVAEAILKQKQVEEERKAKLTKELEEHKRKQDLGEFRLFEESKRADAEKKRKARNVKEADAP